jgi:DsbC/DsbD-like thiol-disulfide interchange protein
MMRRPAVAVAALGMAFAARAQAGEWTQPVEVRHEVQRCVSYRARLQGEYLLVEATLEPGWHTFAMDNERRAAEKLAGRQSLGIDQPTQIGVGEGLEVGGGWLQTAPRDFSKPELRWYSFGFDKKALFAAKVRRSGTGAARITVRGQACTETTCKNIDVALSLPLAGAGRQSDAAPQELKTLVPVR